ncbi:hypothetical protein ACFLZW_01185 [Chloroflexota bacterium]
MKRVFGFVLVAILVLAIVPAAAAQIPAPGGPFNTSFRVQNIEATTAQCSYSFYNSGGTSAYSSGLQSVPGGDSLFVYVPGLALPAGQYSAVVSCDKKAAAVVNYSDADSGAAHGGVDQPSDTWYAPVIYDNYYGFYTNVVVQNASGGAVDVTIDIYQAGSGVPVYSNTVNAVPKNGFVNFDQAGLAQLSDDVPYAAKVSATGSVAPVVNIYGTAAYDGQLYSYNPFPSGTLTSFTPQIMNNYWGYNTSLTIQNVGTGADADFTVTYYEQGTTYTHTDPYTGVGQYESVVVYHPLSALPAGNTHLYGAKISSTNGVPIVAMVNESNNYNRAASYSGFPSGSGEQRLPVVFKDYYRWNTSTVCMNIGTGAATMTIEYFGLGVGAPTTSPSIGQYQIYNFYQPLDPALAAVPQPNWIGSAKVTSAQNVVCMVNEDQNMAPEATTAMDQLYSYNGIVVVP